MATANGVQNMNGTHVNGTKVSYDVELKAKAKMLLEQEKPQHKSVVEEIAPKHERPPGYELISTDNVTPYESKLLQAIRAFPDRVEMWVGRGNPMKNHKKLLAMYIRFFEIANEHKLEYWLEYGSLLGYIRHRGISPWEWDMDIGCTPENYKRFLEVGAEYEKNDPVWGFKFYHDPDYGRPGFSFYLKEDPDVLCDICEYKPDATGKYLECAVTEWHYPPYLMSDILPVKRVWMLGQTALVPAKSELLLGKVEDILGQCTGSDGKPNLNKIPYSQYDPIPFLLCHMFNPFHAHKLLLPPVIDVPIASSITEGLEKWAKKGLPFIVKNIKPVGFNRDILSKRAKELGIKAHAWGNDLEQIDDVLVADAVEDWKKDQLKVNFTDYPIPGVVDESTVDAEFRKIGLTSKDMMLVLSNRLAHSKWHQDQVGYGGGWMWLAEGQKMWQLIDFADSTPMLKEGGGCYENKPLSELLYMDNHSMWGKFMQAYIEANDFLYFPPGCAHRVWTYDRACGVGGYLAYGTSPQEKDRMVRIAQWYAANSLDIEWGVWPGGRRAGAVAVSVPKVA